MTSIDDYMDNLLYTVKINAKIRSHCPGIFREILQIYDLDEQVLINSLHPNKNREQIFKTNKNSSNTNDGGRSGSFFFFTQDQQFLVKTMTTYERKTLIGILPHLVKHLKEQKERKKLSLMAPIFGLYTVKIQG